MKKLFLFTMSAMVLFSSCHYIGGKRVRGNTHVKTEERSVGTFDGVASHGSFDVYVSSGSPSVKIEAEDNLLPYIETYVDNSILHVETKEGFWLRPKRSIKIYVSSPNFKSIKSYGSGDIIGQTPISDSSKMELAVTGSANIRVEVKAPEVDAEITGSGDIDLKGETKVFKSEIRGSGNVKAMDLKAEEATVKISGSGDADIYASVKLNVSVAGSGDIRYKGNAQVNSNIAGSGGVKKVD